MMGKRSGWEGRAAYTKFWTLPAALRGALGRAEVDALLDGLPDLCQVVWLSDADQLGRAARRAHGTGLAMADALILTSLLDAGATTVYTTDADFERYDGPERVVLLTPPE